MIKSKIKQILAITGLSLLLFAIVSVSPVTSEIATAESATATRTLPAVPVSAGEFFSVRIDASDYGIIMGQVLETLPAGFKYATSTLDPGSVEVVGNTVKFYLLGETSFNYTVIAPDTEGTYYFSGMLIDMDKNESEVGGAKEIKVEPAAAIATRTLPAEPVSASANFTVGIEASGYGIMGQVEETLPAGFTYVKSTLDPGSVEVVDNTVTFTLFGESSFNYTVTASNTVGTYHFSGMLVDINRKEYEVGGDKEIVVESATATRTLPAEPVPADGCFLVEIEVSDYGMCGQVIETLPEGFIFMSSTLNLNVVTVDGSTNTVTFTLCDETYFTYTVKTPDANGTYSFRGILKDEKKNEYEVGGDKEIEVEEKEEGAEPLARRMLPVEPVPTGANFTVGIEASGYGSFGQIVETLPAGFVYVNSSLDSESVEVKNNTVKFTLFGETSLNYTAAASNSTGTYNFTGVLKDMNMNEYEVGGDTEIVVGLTEGTSGVESSIEPEMDALGVEKGK